MPSPQGGLLYSLPLRKVDSLKNAGCTTSPIVALSGLMAAHGDVGEAIGMALADGRIDCSELMDIEDA